MQLEEVLSRFQNTQRNGKGFKARCPVHDDAKNSLSIGEANNGKILVKCMAGCSTKAVIDSVGLSWKDLSGSSDGASQPPIREPVIARYPYVDANGKPLFQVSRTRDKNFF